MGPGEGLAPRDLTLDRDVRDWVLVPISVAMFLVGVLRHLASKVGRASCRERV